MTNAITPEIFGRDLFGDVVMQPTSGPVAARFLFPPFSVLDARAGEWQERKRAWLDMGIRGEIGRNALAGGAGTSASSCYLIKRADGIGATSGALHGSGEEANCSSAFDPVLCEIAYRWFCPHGGQGVMKNLQRKATQADRMFSDIVEHMAQELHIKRDNSFAVKEEIPSWL